MLTGTRVLIGDEASVYNGFISVFTQVLLKHNFLELVIPSIWKGELITGVCPIIQEMHKEWVLLHPRPVKLFYVARTFKSGRESTKFGVTILGSTLTSPYLTDMSIDLMLECFDRYGNDYVLKEYEDSFQVEFSGAIVGSGRKYADRISWYIDIERLMLIDI